MADYTRRLERLEASPLATACECTPMTLIVCPPQAGWTAKQIEARWNELLPLGEPCRVHGHAMRERVAGKDLLCVWPTQGDGVPGQRQVIDWACPRNRLDGGNAHG